MYSRMKQLFDRMSPYSEAGFGREKETTFPPLDKETPSMFTGRLASLGLGSPTGLRNLATVRPIKSFWGFWSGNFGPKRYFWLKIMLDIIKVLKCGFGLRPTGKKLSPGSFLPIRRSLTRWNPFGGIHDAREPITISSLPSMSSSVLLKLCFVIFNIIPGWYKIILNPICDCQKLCRYL